MVNKYIGETEKNLCRLFDAAESGPAMLFFDEADALFGKRSEVKEAHDRCANIEVNYLLQRTENYRGLAVLATNMREALDQAFLRRLRFIVTFPFPGTEQRRAIWERAFPPKARVEDLDYDRLACLPATGGMEQNIALNAAFIAAHPGRPGRWRSFCRRRARSSRSSSCRCRPRRCRRRRWRWWRDPAAQDPRDDRPARRGRAGGRARAARCNRGRARRSARGRPAPGLARGPCCTCRRRASTRVATRPCGGRCVAVTALAHVYGRAAPRKTCSCGAPVVVNGECAECNAKRVVLQRSPVRSTPPGAVPPLVGDVIGSSQPTIAWAAPARMSRASGRGLGATGLGAGQHDFSRIPVSATAETDAFEREADAVAERLSAGAPANRRVRPLATPHSIGTQGPHALGEGRPLPADVRREMEPRLAFDLGAVRVHTGPSAECAARAQAARAYTIGRHVVLGASAGAPESASGRQLLAHELAHVVQQAGRVPETGAHRAPPRGDPVAVQRQDDPADLRRLLAANERRAAKPVSLRPEELQALSNERQALLERLNVAMRAGGRTARGAFPAVPSSPPATAGEPRASGPVAAEPEAFSTPAEPTPRDLVRLVVEQRHFGTATPTLEGGTPPIAGNALARHDPLDDIAEPIARGTAAGPGYQTNAAVQVLDGRGRQVAVELAQYEGGGNPHAEAQGVARLRFRLAGRTFPGGRLVAAVDQAACGGCLARLRALAVELGLSRFEVWAPSPQEGRSAGVKWTARTAATRPARPGQPPVAETPGGAAYRMEPRLIQGETLAAPAPAGTAPAAAKPPFTSTAPTPAATPPVKEPATQVRVGETQTARIADPNAPEPPKLRIEGDKVVPLEEIGVLGDEARPSSARKAQAQQRATAPPPATTQSPRARADSNVAASAPPARPQPAVSAPTPSGDAKTPAPGAQATAPATTPAAQPGTTTAAQPAAPKSPSTAGTAGAGAAAAEAPAEATPPRLTGSQGQRVYGGAQPTSEPVTPTKAPERAGEAFQAALVMLEVTRARLEDIADDGERDKAVIWLVQNRPVIYQTLFEHPGAGMTVQFHFERVKGRLEFRGATPQLAINGTPPPEASEDSFDITGTGVKLFFPPVRKAPQAPVKEAPQRAAAARLRLIQSAEELIGLLPNNTSNLASYYALQDAHGAGVMGPFRMRLGVTEFEVTAVALDQAILAYRVRLESSLGERLQRLANSLARSQKDLDAAMTTHGNFATKWWYRQRIALLDPHVLDKPREHEAAARDAIARGDFRAAAERLRAAEDMVMLNDERIHQFHEGVDRVEERAL